MRSLSMARTRPALATVALLSLLGATPAAGQSDYTFTVIALQSTDCSVASEPVLNNSGQVAFYTTCGTGYVVQRGTGGTLTPIHSWTFGTAGYVPDYRISINDNGLVAFQARNSQSAQQLIFVGSGSGIVPVVDTNIQTQYKDLLQPVINASGAVAFMADTDSSQGYDSVIVVNNGSFTTVAGPGTSSGLGSLVYAAYPGRLNSSGVATFLGQLSTTYGVFTGAGGPLTTIASGGSESIFNSINADGRVSFVGIVNNEYAVQTSQGGARTIIATSANGYTVPTATSINDSGKVAFLSPLTAGGTGVFTGPDPQTDYVIKTGPDFSLPGVGLVTVTNVSIGTEALNNTGQVALLIRYDTGDGFQRWAILRADPTNRAPTASNGTATVTAGASVSGTLSATDPDGDALTYAIVANGSKGTAAVTNTATGAYTYTANTGTSGSDEFSFRVTDSHGATSDPATMAITIEPAPACAIDVTSRLTVTTGSYRVDRKTGHYFQKVTLKNTSSTPIAGPVSFVVDSLPAGVSLVNAAGQTSCATPVGSPYVGVNVGSDGMLSARERANVGLELTLEFASPGTTPTYTPRVLAGSGGR